jgi:hypothetical protein
MDKRRKTTVEEKKIIKLRRKEKVETSEEKEATEHSQRMRETREKFKDVKLYIAIPSGTMVHADFAMSLASLTYHLTQIGVKVALNNTKNAEIAYSRNLQIEDATKRKATHILYIDSDMVFPSITAHRLLDIMFDSGCEKKIVGVTVPKRRYPYTQVAKDLVGQPINIQPVMKDSEEVIEVGELGTGLLMFDMKVFEKLEQPYFAPYYRDDKDGKPILNGRVSEDLSLIYKLKKLGHKIYCDIALSRDVKHIGDIQFDWTSKDFFADAIELRRQKMEEVINKSLKKQQDPSKMSKKKINFTQTTNKN